MIADWHWIVDCQLPIANFVLSLLERDDDTGAKSRGIQLQLAIGNWQSAIGNYDHES